MASVVMALAVMKGVVSMGLGIAVLGMKVFSGSVGVVDGAGCVSEFPLRMSKANDGAVEVD